MAYIFLSAILAVVAIAIAVVPVSVILLQDSSQAKPVGASVPGRPPVR